MKIDKIPANDGEAIKSGLIPLFEKKNVMNFYKYVENIEWEG